MDGFVGILIRRRYLQDADGTMTDVMLQAALDVEVQRGKIERKVGLAEIADRTLLLEAQKELGIK